MARLAANASKHHPCCAGTTFSKGNGIDFYLDLTFVVCELYAYSIRGKWAVSWQNQQNGMCAQRRLRSAWVSAQSDQSLRCPLEESLGPELPIKRTAKTLIRLGGCPGWSVFTGRTCHFVGFVTMRLKYPCKFNSQLTVDQTPVQILSFH